MSHADDGTLHAYLDGELSALEVARLEAHLADCAPCRARLDEERDVVARTSRILALAEPPERPAPPLHQLRHPRLAWRVRMPLAVAASLVVALGAGWFAFGTLSHQEARSVATAPPSETHGFSVSDSIAPPANEIEGRAPPTGVAAAPQRQALAQPPTPDTSPRAAVAEEVAAERARAENAAIRIRGEAGALAGAQAAAPAALVVADGRRLPTDEIDLDSARALLGGEIHAIDGVAIRAVRRAGAAVVVEQAVAPEVIVRLREETERPGRVTVTTRSGPEQVVGRVTDATSGEPVAKAYVTVTGTPRGAVTSARGAFVIDSVPPGTYSLQARMLGYEPLVLSPARVDSGRTTAVEFALRQASVTLSEVVVTADQAARRRDAAAPQAAAVPTADLVRRVGRLRVWISGPLPADSLATLLEKVRPVP